MQTDGSLLLGFSRRTAGTLSRLHILLCTDRWWARRTAAAINTNEIKSEILNKLIYTNTHTWIQNTVSNVTPNTKIKRNMLERHPISRVRVPIVLELMSIINTATILNKWKMVGYWKRLEKKIIIKWYALWNLFKASSAYIKYFCTSYLIRHP